MTTTLTANPESAVRLADFPIPADQVTSGAPTARIWINSQSADLKVTQGVWDCTAGTFTWDYGWDEFLMILEGEATITSESGSTTLRSGDHAHFPLGLKVTWHVPAYVKKTFVLRTPAPLEL